MPKITYVEEAIYVKFLRLGIIYTLSVIFTLLSLVQLIKEYIFNGSNIFTKNIPARPKCLDDYKSNFLHLKNGVKLHYVMKGDKGKELMLFIHGFPEFWYSWRRQLDYFKDNYCCVAIDMRGYGESDKPNGIDEYKIENLIEDIENVILQLGYQKAVVVGHDWGAIVSWMFAIFYSEMVSKLIIMDVPHPKAGEIIYKSNFKQMAKSWYMYFFQFPVVPEIFLSLNNFQPLRNMFKGKKGGLCNRDKLSNEDINSYVYTFGSQPNGFTGPINYYRSYLQRWNLIKYPKEPIKSETLIIFGEKDFFVITENAYLSQNYCSKSKVVIVKNASHWVQQDAPEEVNKAIENFLCSS
uniref:AB hydrolase-1 domain-containing protein n=1 Tax=Strongyloides venezuelensis TaxID=75913 RepID=A0A0K0F622_STRVS